MATKKPLSSMTFAAIMGNNVEDGEKQSQAEPAEKLPESKPEPAAAKRSSRPKVEDVAPAVQPEPIPEPAYVQQRRPGRPASKSPKRNYGVSLCIEDYEALKQMAKGSDKTITELLTLMIAEYDRHHPELREKYRKIQALLNS